MPANHLQQLSEQGCGFAVFPDARIFKTPGKNSVHHLLFGDFISPPKNTSGKGNKKWTQSLTKEVNGETWIQARSRGVEGWMRLEDIQVHRILEVNFVDIGQGDGCHMVTPSDEHFIIDAGEGDNMYRFLRWRFNLSAKGGKLPKFFGVMSHPDEDHWKGFELLLSKPPADIQRTIEFSKLYHNGIIQRAGSSAGETIEKGDQIFLKDFIQKQEDVQEILDADGKKSNFEKFLIGALKNSPSLKIETVFKDLSKKKVLYKDDFMEMEVLAPIPEKIDGQLMLRWFDGPKMDGIGKTKNGHSIVLVVHIGKMKILLGGDLNSESADYLMEKYSGKNIRALRAKIDAATNGELPALQQEMKDLVNTCRKHFQVEVAKSCHHGSSDVTNELMAAINPIATVISSGDEESFCHPRPETLGAIGKFGRGDRPLIYSTELARSSPQFIKLKAKKETSDKKQQRIVSTYGMITLRTDGENAVIAQKLEKGRSQFGKIVKWHIDKLIWNDKRQEFVSKK
jgi:beta-lactamase superfamily II metal-dependent hydrolase